MPYRTSPKNPTWGTRSSGCVKGLWHLSEAVDSDIIVLNGLSFNSGGAQGTIRYLFLLLLWPEGGGAYFSLQFDVTVHGRENKKAAVAGSCSGSSLRLQPTPVSVMKLRYQWCPACFLQVPFPFSLGSQLRERHPLECRSSPVIRVSLETLYPHN